MPTIKWGYQECREHVCFICLNERVKHKKDVERMRSSDISLIRKHLMASYDMSDDEGGGYFVDCRFVFFAVEM